MRFGCVTSSGRLCCASRQAEPGHVPEVAGRAPTELNPYVCDLRFHQLLVSLKRYKRWSDHDHSVSEGGLEPLAYVLTAGGDPWLSV
jgi:hypothetical protein